MSVRGFLTWYIIAIMFVGAAGASLVQGVKWQHAGKSAAVSQPPAPEPTTPRHDVAEAVVPTTSPPTNLPALRPPLARERMTPHATAQNVKPVPSGWSSSGQRHIPACLGRLRHQLRHALSISGAAPCAIWRALAVGCGLSAATASSAPTRSIPIGPMARTLRPIPHTATLASAITVEPPADPPARDPIIQLQPDAPTMASADSHGNDASVNQTRGTASSPTSWVQLSASRMRAIWRDRAGQSGERTTTRAVGSSAKRILTRRRSEGHGVPRRRDLMRW